MFFPGSRYEKLPIREAMDPTGRVVRYVAPRVITPKPLQGYHTRVDGQRLDLVASHYFNDPSAFWLLCDANGTVAPEALSTAPRVGIPVTGR